MPIGSDTAVAQSETFTERRTASQASGVSCTSVEHPEALRLEQPGGVGRQKELHEL